MKKKVMEWIKRYAVAEGVGLFTATAGGMILHLLTGSAVLAALGGTWGENAGYYSTIIYREFTSTKRYHTSFIKRIISVIGSILIEFGPAEYLDSLIVRPGAMLVAQHLLHSVPLGLIAGKLVADIVFYMIAISMYETKKKISSRKTNKERSE